MANEPRSERISVSLTPTTLARLNAHASEHHWSTSLAAAILIEDALRTDQDNDSKQGARSR